MFVCFTKVKQRKKQLLSQFGFPNIRIGERSWCAGDFKTFLGERERGRKENGIEVEPRYNALINSAKSTRITEATMASELSRVWSRWASFHTDI